MQRIVHIQPKYDVAIGRVPLALVLIAAAALAVWWWGHAVTSPQANAPATRAAHAWQAWLAAGPTPALPRAAQDVVPGSATDNTALLGQGAGAVSTASDIRERNAGIPIEQLTSSRPMAANALLSEVLLAAHPRGGFEVKAVEPGGVYDKMGLRKGDVIYSIDTPLMSGVDESSMVSLMQQTQIELNIYRNGTLINLLHALNVEEGSDAPPEE